MFFFWMLNLRCRWTEFRILPKKIEPEFDWRWEWLEDLRRCNWSMCGEWARPSKWECWLDARSDGTLRNVCRRKLFPKIPRWMKMRRWVPILFSLVVKDLKDLKDLIYLQRPSKKSCSNSFLFYLDEFSVHKYVSSRSKCNVRIIRCLFLFIFCLFSFIWKWILRKFA